MKTMAIVAVLVFGMALGLCGTASAGIITLADLRGDWQAGSFAGQQAVNIPDTFKKAHPGQGGTWSYNNYMVALTPPITPLQWDTVGLSYEYYAANHTNGSEYPYTDDQYVQAGELHGVINSSAQQLHYIWTAGTGEQASVAYPFTLSGWIRNWVTYTWTLTILKNGTQYGSQFSCHSSTTPFNVSLTTLNPGDTIDFRLTTPSTPGPLGVALSVTITQEQPVSEPAGLGLVGAAVLAIARRKRT